MHKSNMADAAARRAFNADLERLNLRVHSPDDAPLFTREPQSAVQVRLWRWQDMAPLFERLGKEIDLGSGGQRRTLRLANPGLSYGTTHTFWGSIQYILPGEIAGAHRHSASALRFITHGSGAYTTVEGERYPMSQGDLVLTPAWTWHDHEHCGSEPMIWLDVLDISLMRSMHATFFEPAASEQGPVDAVPDRSWREYGSGIMRPLRRGAAPVPAANPLLAYPRARAEAALQEAMGLTPDPFDDVILEYQNPATGGSALPTLAMTLQLLRPGVHCKARRHTGSKLYQVVRGRGATIVNGQRFDWETGDYLVVPPWAWHEHLNRSGADEAVLFQVNDVPALRALGYYRDEALTTNNGYQ